MGVITARWEVGDPQVDAFVEQNLLSFVAWDIVICFNRDPAKSECLSRLSALLGRHKDDMTPALQLLVDNGVLSERSDADDTYYQLTDDPQMRGVVERFVRLSAVREHRLEFVRRVLAHVTSAQ